MELITLNDKNLTNVIQLMDMDVPAGMRLFNLGDMIELQTWRRRVARFRSKDRERRLAEAMESGAEINPIYILKKYDLPPNWLEQIGVESHHAASA